MENLGFWVTHDEVNPLTIKVEAINNMTPPTDQKVVRKCVGLVNYYCYMWETGLYKL